MPRTSTAEMACNKASRARPWGLALSLAMLLPGCMPRENWREMPVGTSGLTALFPCKPSATAREVAAPTVASEGVAMRWSMLSCDTAVWWTHSEHALTFAVMWVDVGNPADVEPMLERLQQASLDATSARLLPLKVPGATPHRRSGRWEWQRVASDGHKRTQQSAFAARGTLVVQASVVGRGASLDEKSAEPFFQGLRWSER